ncbi:Protein FAM13A [Frankliniella fusca]|uniref:Protein FAM13A n=1 Tax=Frankliniella fusca TaxID=407009 RepID=A0AAE1LQT3_9NEOP|nr:Protein FAM13A [Frankliniella fusca]
MLGGEREGPNGLRTYTNNRGSALVPRASAPGPWAPVRRGPARPGPARPAPTATLWNIAKDCLCGCSGLGGGLGGGLGSGSGGGGRGRSLGEDCCRRVMRRPTLCGQVHTVDLEGDDAGDATYLHRDRDRDRDRAGKATGTASSSSKESQVGGAGAGAGAGQGRLSRVKRLLADSLLLGARRGSAAVSGAVAPSRTSRAGSSRQFGVPLADVALNKDGVPVVVARICGYLENHGLQCEDLFQSPAANPRLADKLRSTLDLEGASDAFTVALLLKLWLKELPEPIIWGHVASDLLSTHGKVCDELVETWRQAIRLVLCTLPETNLRLLRYILRFLHRYNHHQQQRSSTHSVLTHLGIVFAPLLVLRGLEYYGADQLSRANILTTRLIQDQASIFHQWIIDHPNEITSSPTRKSPNSRKKHYDAGTTPKNFEGAENSNCTHQRKRKERNESANSNQSLERKVIRSSSEERQVELTATEQKNENIRRVSSHEDFSHVKQQGKAQNVNRHRFSTVVEIFDQPQSVHFSGLPLHECNHIEASPQSRDNSLPAIQNSVHESCLQQKENEMQSNQQSLKVRDRFHAEPLEDEHEKRRSSERFSRSLIPPRSVARRNINRKKRVHSHAPSDNSVLSIKSNKKDQATIQASQNIAQTSVTQHVLELMNQRSLSSDECEDDCDPEVEVESLSDESRPGSSHSFLQLHPPERERSPSPSISPCTPPLDLTTLHQSVDGNEPVASRVSWDFVRQQHQGGEADRGILLSPRNSMILTRRVYMDHNVPPSPPGDHHGSCLPGPALDLENIVKKFNKQIASIKKKLKRYEEGFEKEFGYRPSQADKMANKDIKKMYSDLSRIRKELKQIKENPLSAMASQPDPNTLRLGLSSKGVNAPADQNNFSNVNIEDTVEEVEKRLMEKRKAAGRPESIEEMTPEQQAAEKLAMQKALLMLEKICGRATSKQDREIVRPLYDRYRLLKRIVARATSSKLKDSINELATIHEHEAMDFSQSTSLLAMVDGGQDGTSTPPVQGFTQNSVNANYGVSGNGNALQTQPSTEETSDSQTSSSDSLGENLHALPLSDLVLQLTQTREEKKKLRRLLREQEEQFQHQTGRKMQREDRLALAGDATAKDYSLLYTSYKQIKAKLRLLEALVAKQRQL